MWLILLVCHVAGAAKPPAEVVAGRDQGWLLKKLAKEDRVAMRAAIVAELGALRSPDVLPQLLRTTADRAAEVRTAALGALAAYGGDLADPERDGALLTGLGDGNPACVAAAELGLADRLQARVDAGMDRLVAQLIQLTQSGASWQSRRAAVRLLERSPPSRDADQRLAEVAAQDPHAEVRRSAVLALGARGVGSAAGVLSRVRNTDSDEQVRLAAEAVLARMDVAASDAVLAVLPFETRARGLQALAAEMPAYFTASLASARVATVVERAQVDAVLRELRFQDQNIDDGQAVQVGKMLRATQVVTGTLHVVGDEVTCAAKRIDVVTGQVWAPLPAIGTLHDLAAVQRDCAARLASTF